MEGTPRTSMNQQMQPSADQFNIREFLGLCLSRWYWFVISVVICLGCGVFYILKTPKVYTRSATLLIKESTSRRSSNDLEQILSGGGMSQMSSKLPNEIVALQSPDLMKDVVCQLGLDYNYAFKGRFKMAVAYGKGLPAKVSFTDFTGYATMTVTPDGKGSYVISDLVYALDGKEIKDKSKSYKVAALDTVQTPIGGVCVLPQANYKGDWKEALYVTHTTIASATRRYNNLLSANAVDMKNYSDALSLTISDQSPQRAEDVLSTVISVYNANWVADRNKIAVSTTLFIDDRLAAIEKDLGNVDSDISSFKSRNVIPDVAAASSMYMSQTTEVDRQLQDLDNQIYISRYIRNYLAASSNPGELIPAMSGFGNSSITSQITAYNTLALERNNMVSGSSESNPLVVDMDTNLKAMRTSIVSAVDSQIETLEAQRDVVRSKEKKVTGRLADNPNQEMYLLSVERQQKVKEALYLFLLQKREENELSQAFTAYNTRVLTNPTGSSAPTSPQTSRIMFVCLILGLCIPLGLIYLLELLNTKLRGRKDLESISMPLIGEIPQYYHEGDRPRIFSKPKTKDVIVVSKGNRDAINEAFRVLRTNLEFVTKGSEGNVYAVASFNPGSGKTFITMNLAVTLAIKGKKVLVIDGDLRHASSSAYVGRPKHGLTDYLVGKTDDLASLICHPSECEALDILPVGTIPPNPTELVGDAAFGTMIESLRPQYDVIFIDCPPVEIVADTQIIAAYVDRTIFVVRAGLLERAMIPEIDNLYNEGKYKQMSLVLNGTEYQKGRYGYRYGYGYGYRYGYHSGDYYSAK